MLAVRANWTSGASRLMLENPEMQAIRANWPSGASRLTNENPEVSGYKLQGK